MTTSSQRGFLASGRGLFGRKKSSDGSGLANLAQSTEFPKWNTLKQKISPELKPRNTANDLKSYHKSVTNPNIIQDKVLLERRCSDTSLLTKHVKPSEEPSLSPSHYKGNRRGTYAAVYDPRATQARPRADTRSRSLFIKAADEQLSNPDLRIHLLKTFHKNKDAREAKNTDSDSSSATEEGSQAGKRKNRKHAHRCSKGQRNLKPDIENANISPRNHLRRQERAMSSFQNLSKEHVQYLEKKHNQQQNFNDSCTDSSSSTCSDDENLPAIHDAASKGDIEELSKLIDEGHDVNLVDSRNNLPCYYALLNGHFDCVALLVSQGADMQDYFERQRSKYFR